MKYEIDPSDMIGCLQAVKICSFVEEIKLFIGASYIVFLFVKSQNNSINMFPLELFAANLKQVKTLDCISGFLLSALEFSQTFISVFTRL